MSHAMKRKKTTSSGTRSKAAAAAHPPAPRVISLSTVDILMMQSSDGEKVEEKAHIKELDPNHLSETCASSICGEQRGQAFCEML